MLRGVAPLRVLVTPAAMRRVLGGAGLVFAERMLLPAAALAAVRGSIAQKLIWAGLLSVVFTAHALGQRVSAALLEAQLSVRISEAVLYSDVLRESVLAKADTRTEIVQANYHVARLIAEALPGLLADACACVVLGVIMVCAEPLRVVGWVVGLMVVAALALFLTQRAVVRSVASAHEAQREVYEALHDVLEARLEIVASGLRTHVLTQLRRKADAFGAAGVKIATSSTISGRLPALAVTGAVGAALLASSSLRQFAHIQLTDVAFFATVTPAYAGLAQGLQALTTGEPWLAILSRLLKSSTDEASGRTSPGAMPAPTIRFDGVTYRYPDVGSGAAPALDAVDVRWVGPGAFALTGLNGSGKSTFLRLLLALATPASGRVCVGAHDLARVDADGWRACCAFLPQRPYLPPRASVRSAIQWLVPEATDAAILAALERAQLLPVLRRTCDDPLAVPVETLSVGQRQRVALARVLCRDAALYILDEPDANLDRAGILLTAELIRELRRDRIVVFAAHTRELLAEADQVVCLEEGRVLIP